MKSIVEKFGRLFDRRQKLKIIILGILMIIGAFLETFSVSLIIPLVSSVLDQDIIQNNILIGKLCFVFGIESNKEFMEVVIAILILTFVFKNIFLFIEYYIQYRFIYNNRFEIQRRVLTAYLKRPYEFFLYINSGEVIRAINNDIANTFALLTNVLSFFTEAFVSGALLCMLIYIDFTTTFFLALVLGVTIMLIAYVIKPKLKGAGELCQQSTAQANKWLLQSIAGIKEVKVSKKENVFIKQYEKYGRITVASEKLNSILSIIPRLLIETVTISGMLILILFLLNRGRELANMIPQLSAFGFAAVRLVPSANRLSTYYNMASFMEPALDKVLENLYKIDEWQENDKGNELLRNSSKITLKDKIQLVGVSFSYKGSEEMILNKADMEIPVGKSVGIIGVSGAGKTTVVDIVLGLLQPNEGNVLVDGLNIKEDYGQWLNCIGYIPQMIFLLDDTIRANIAFGVDNEEVSEDRIWHVLEEAKLADFVRKLPEQLNTTIGERGVRLSGGQRQRMGIARALYNDPEILIFDEATSALDNDTEAAIMSSINSFSGRKTVIIIAHRLKTIEACDLIYNVESGKAVKQ